MFGINNAGYILCAQNFLKFLYDLYIQSFLHLWSLGIIVDDTIHFRKTYYRTI